MRNKTYRNLGGKITHLSNKKKFNNLISQIKWLKKSTVYSINQALAAEVNASVCAGCIKHQFYPLLVVHWNFAHAKGNILPRKLLKAAP